MEMTGERSLPADRAGAWAALNDIELLRLCIPGCESITAAGDERYDAVVHAAVGPVKARFKGTLELADKQPPQGYTLKFEGSGGPAGFARGQAKVGLQEQGGGQTLLSFAVQAQVGGKLAQIGSRLVDAAAGAMADKFFAAFVAQLAARSSAATPGAAPAAPPAPARIGLWSLLWATIRRLFGSR